MTNLIPVLPENAPFSPAQRAWLNGFLAGYLGLAGEQTSSTATTFVSAAEPEAPKEAPAVDHPWHDPSLSLADRMKLAEGRPVDQRLMAAMGQLDCGQCGYLCQSYAEALANGTEKDGSLCVPGGKATTKTVRELLSIAPLGNGSTTNGHTGAQNGRTTAGNGFSSPKLQGVLKPAAHSANGHAAKREIVRARLVRNERLNGDGSAKDTRLIAFDLAGTGLRYEVGDSLGVLPENCSETVGAVLKLLGADPHRPVAGAAETTLQAALQRSFCLRRPREELLALLADVATDVEHAAVLRELIDQDHTEEVLDLLERFPSARPEIEPFLAALGKLQPRLYSISSSQRAYPNEVHLTVGVVRYDEKGRSRRGVASTFLGDRLVVGGEVGVFVQQSHGFRLPADGGKPIIMIGPGTGVAPFRAFLQERAALKAAGRNWLFFGDQKEACDFLFREELEAFQKTGFLHRLDAAFSRDQEEKLYVQTRMRQHGAELWQWLEAGAHLYVCGDAKRMARDVDAALHEIIAEHGRRSAGQAKEYVSQLSSAKRYQRDVY